MKQKKKENEIVRTHLVLTPGYNIATPELSKSMCMKSFCCFPCETLSTQLLAVFYLTQYCNIIRAYHSLSHQ